MSTYSVHDEEGFARTYDEDDVVQVRKGDLRAVLDVATGSMDFGSGFLDNEQVEALRKLADMIGIDPLLVTPSNFTCQYKGEHAWGWVTWNGGMWRCQLCNHTDSRREPPHGLTRKWSRTMQMYGTKDDDPGRSGANNGALYAELIADAAAHGYEPVDATYDLEVSMRGAGVMRHYTVKMEADVRRP